MIRTPSKQWGVCDNLASVLADIYADQVVSYNCFDMKPTSMNSAH